MPGFQKGLNISIVLAGVILAVAVVILGLVFLNLRPAADKLPPLTSAPSVAVSKKPKVKIFLVVLEDNGKSGKKIGCDDSLISRDTEADLGPDTAGNIKTAFEKLLAFEDNQYTAGGIYSALSNAEVEFDVSFLSGNAVVNLTGELRLGGVCDDPRAQEQITATIRQFREVRQAEVFINGKKLSEAFSLK